MRRKPRISRSKRDTETEEGSGDEDYYYDENDNEYVLSFRK